MTGVNYVPLSVVAVDRGLIGGPFGSNLGKKDYVASGIPVLRGQNLSRGRHVQFDDCVYVTDEKQQRDLARNTARAGDVVFTQRGTLGQVAIMPVAAPMAVVSQSQMRLRVDENRADPNFVYYCATAPDFLRQIHGNAIVAGVPHINLGILGKLEIPLPPLSRQKRIARVLGSLDDLIQSNTDAICRFDAIGSLLLEREIQSLAALGDALHEVPLSQAAALIETGSRPRGGVKGFIAGVPSIGAESIRGIAQFDFAKTKFVPHDFAAQMKRGVLTSRDVLVYKDGGKPGTFIPHVGMFGGGFPYKKMVINEHVYRVKGSPDFTEAYLYFWLKSQRMLNEMAVRGTGAAIPGLNSTAFKALPVAMPDSKMRMALIPALDALVDASLALALESKELTSVRDELLPLLLSGRVSPGEAAA